MAFKPSESSTDLQQKTMSTDPSTAPSPLVWFITGTSQGFGRELVRLVLARGDMVVATSRDATKVAAAFPEGGDRLLPTALDLHDAAAIKAAVDGAVARFGRIDVLVNNAGHGIIGALEEVSDEEVAAVFEVNIHGLLRVTRAVLPHLRQQRGGHVVNISSIGGLVGLPGYSTYNATKFAVEGLSEALAAEVNPLGIRVTVVEPGPFRTDFLGSSLVLAKETIADYAETSGKTRTAAGTRHGNQPGDPARGAQAIIDAVISDHPPLHLPLGRFAYDRGLTKFEAMRTEFERCKEAAIGADFTAEELAASGVDQTPLRG